MKEIKVTIGSEQIELTELFYQHESALRMYLTICGIEAQDADEVLQDVFLTAWRKINTLQDTEAFPAWIRTIAQRKAWRYRGRMMHYWKRNYPLSCYEEEQKEAGKPLPEELIYHQMEQFSDTDLYDMVMELGYPASNILLLHYVYSEQYEEIARTLHMPSGTVRSIASRSREKLKKMIEERRCGNDET